MKPSKINIPILIGVFVSVGLIADLLPYPGLAPGMVSRTMDWVLSQGQPESVNATREMVGPATLSFR
jgi:hypothetical protein